MCMGFSLLNIMGLVVDEAHCVKTWGDSFRCMLCLDQSNLLSSVANVLMCEM